MTGNQQVQAHLGALWTLLSQMKIEGPGAERRFEEALAADKGWSLDFAERVSREYRRFLYLAASAPGEITPSRTVDAAWHLHLTYSRHYWDELCGRILGRPLHHDPSEGGPGAGVRYLGQYGETLALYRSTFGSSPPPDIWPPLPEPVEAAEPSEEEQSGIRPLTALLCAPFMIILGAVSGGTVGAIIGAACVAVTIIAFILYGPPTPPPPAAPRKPAHAGCSGGCGTSVVFDTTGSDGSSCGGGCGGD